MLWFLTQCQTWGRYLPSLIGLCLHQTGNYPLTPFPQQTKGPWEWRDPGGGSSSPDLIRMGGGNTNIVSETARSVWPGIRPGLEALPEQGKKEGRREGPLLSTYCMPGPVADLIHVLSPREVESFFLL